MTDLRQAAQQALEALADLQGGCTDSDDGTVEALTVWCPQVIADLRSALAQPERSKPLTNKEIWQMVNDCTIGGDLHADKFARAIEAAHGIKE